MKVVDGNFIISKDDVRRCLLHIAEQLDETSKNVSNKTFYDYYQGKSSKKKDETPTPPNHE